MTTYTAARSMGVGADRPQDRLPKRAPVRRRLLANVAAAKSGSALANLYRTLLAGLTQGEDRAAAWRAARGMLPIASASRTEVSSTATVVATSAVIGATIPTRREPDDGPPTIVDPPPMLVRAPRAPETRMQRTA
ncbi:hypothetical protein [Microbacterium sp.]|uniref:hypothetical protein n=1 Tax=Microbacterium sp. TaxID=51671 RepID=UPI003736C092